MAQWTTFIILTVSLITIFTVTDLAEGVDTQSINKVLSLRAGTQLDECVDGPSVWCRDLAAAKKCGAVKHCTSTVWAKQLAANDEVCTFCVMLMKDIRNMLRNNATEQELTAYLLMACSQVKDDAGRYACTDAVKRFFPEILGFLGDQVNPKVICRAMTLCHSTISQHSTATVVTDTFDVCDTCKQYVSEIQKDLANPATTTEIESYLNAVCDTLANQTIVQECKDDVKQFVPAFIKYLVSVLDPVTLCKELGFCTNSTGRLGASADLKFSPQQLTSATVKGPLCDECKKDIGYVQGILMDPGTAKEIEQYLISICQMIPNANLSKECIDDVNKYTPQVLQFVAKQLDPTTVCTDIGLCPNQTITASFPGVCSTCKIFSGFLKQEITREKFQEFTEDFIAKHVCSHFKSPIDCRYAVVVFTPEILNLVAKFIEKARPCELFHACNSDVSHTVLPPPVPVALSAPHDDYPQCVICEFVITGIDELLMDNATEEEIVSAVDKVCARLPATVSAECHTFISTYGRAIIQLLVRQVQPYEVCKLLSLCSQDIAVYRNPSKHIHLTSPQCTICEYVLQTLDKLLATNATEQEIVAAVDKVCSLCKMVCKYLEIELKEAKTEEEIEKILEEMCFKLPASKEIQQKCDNFVKQWGKYIVELLKQELVNPDYVCQQLGLCPTRDLK